MRINVVGAFQRNFPFATELAFKRGFDRLGVHQMTYIDPSYPNQVWDHGADAVIVFKEVRDESLSHLQKCTGKKIVYQPDDLRFPHIQQMMREMRNYCPYALTFDDDGARLAVQYGYDKAQRLLLTADDELYREIPGTKKDIDLTFIGSLTGGVSHASRRRMIEVLARAGFKVLALADFYDLENLVTIYNRSKVILNHATDVGQDFGTGYGYQCRHFEAGFTRACVLSNRVLNETVLDGKIATFDSEEQLVEQVRHLLARSDLREWYANELTAELDDHHMPEHRANEMIEFIGTL